MLLERNKFRSDEEYYFAHWLEELRVKKLLKSWEYEPETFRLTPTYQVTDDIKMRSTSYTPDFKLTWYPKAKGKVGGFERTKYVDVKGEFSRFQDDFHWTQKLMYMIHGIFVFKAVVPEIFRLTFTPDEYLVTLKKRQPRKLKYKPKTIDEWMNLKK